MKRARKTSAAKSAKPTRARKVSKPARPARKPAAAPRAATRAVVSGAGGGGGVRGRGAALPVGHAVVGEVIVRHIERLASSTVLVEVAGQPTELQFACVCCHQPLVQLVAAGPVAGAAPPIGTFPPAALLGQQNGTATTVPGETLQVSQFCVCVFCLADAASGIAVETITAMGTMVRQRVAGVPDADVMWAEDVEAGLRAAADRLRGALIAAGLLRASAEAEAEADELPGTTLPGVP